MVSVLPTDKKVSWDYAGTIDVVQYKVWINVSLWLLRPIHTVRSKRADSRTSRARQGPFIEQINDIWDIIAVRKASLAYLKNGSVDWNCRVWLGRVFQIAVKKYIDTISIGRASYRPYRDIISKLLGFTTYLKKGSLLTAGPKFWNFWRWVTRRTKSRLNIDWKN